METLSSSGDSDISYNGLEMGKDLIFSKSLHDLSVAGTSASSNRAKVEADNFYNRGRQLHAAGDLASAIDSLTMAITIDPFNDLYYTSRAECLENASLHSAALEDFIHSNILYMYNIRAWRGIIFNTFNLQTIKTGHSQGHVS
jgi:tetratricopeptide (TPR) repeat protein